MADFVQYHHPSNAPLRRRAEFSIYTKKAVDDRIGDRVWVITATAAPRAYFLAEWFIADRVTARARADGMNTVSGRVGQHFDPPLRIDQEPWFPAFRRKVANFSTGFSRISEPTHVEGLVRVAALRSADSDRSAVALDEALERLGWVGPPEERLPEEVGDGMVPRLLEGATRTTVVNAYERNREARRQCVEHYGARCVICAFDFESRYGRVGRGMIHVHHLRSLAEIDQEYEVDPVTDLRPVCPNCHAVIHHREPAYSIEEVQAMIRPESSAVG